MKSPQTRYYDGLAAEKAVIRVYEHEGFTLLKHRFKSARGEIDLVFAQETQLLFVEVKQRRTHDLAALSLSTAQAQRLWRAAEIFLADNPRFHTAEIRFDLALVNATGHVEIKENALRDALF